MYKGRRLLAVVPARGGSKGVPRKNIHLLLGKPLIAHTAELIAAMGIFDCAVVSTEDTEIAEVSKACGLEVPFIRPPELAGDRIADYPVLRHALEELEKQDGNRFDIIVMLQPTSPLRQAKHVTDCVKKLIEENWDAVWTVSPTDLKYHPKKQLRLLDGKLNYDDPEGALVVARQQLDPVYHRNGAAYAFTRECLLEQNTILGKRTSAVVIKDPMISIDTFEDFARIEAILRAQHVEAT